MWSSIKKRCNFAYKYNTLIKKGSRESYVKHSKPYLKPDMLWYPSFPKVVREEFEKDKVIPSSAWRMLNCCCHPRFLAVK
jgi:hypothetical protein